MPHPDNENQYRYGAYDYRTQDEDNRRYQEEQRRQQEETARQMQMEQDRVDREIERENQRRSRNATKPKGSSPSTSRGARSSSQTVKTQTGNEDSINGLITLSGAGGGFYLASINNVNESWQFFAAIGVGALLAYGLRDLIKFAIKLGVVGLIVYGILTYLVPNL